MYEDYLTTMEDVEKELLVTSLANRGMSSVDKEDDEEDDVIEQKPKPIVRMFFLFLIQTPFNVLCHNTAYPSCDFE